MVLLPNSNNTNCVMTCNGICYSLQLSTGWQNAAFRVFSDPKNLTLYHNTFANNTLFMGHGDFARNVAPDYSYYAFDDSTYKAINNLYLGTSLPKELTFNGANTNMLVSSSAFVNSAGNNYKLSSPLSVNSPLSSVTYDIIGTSRGSSPDYGAYEFI
jgi:hypothetical protein